MIVSPRYGTGKGHKRDMTYRRSCLSQTVGQHDVYEPTLTESVYVLLDRAACQVKIGWTRGSVDYRRRSLERETARDLELIGTMRGGYDLERSMHGRFQDHRVEGREWYSSEILAELIPLLD